MRKDEVSGFTLLELLISFSIIATLSTVTIVAYVKYSRTQSVELAARTIADVLQRAKSRTQSQLVLNASGTNICGANPFTGYRVRFVRPSDGGAINTFELSVTCNGAAQPYNYSGRLPASVVFDETSPNPTVAFVTFLPIAGVIESPSIPATVKINGNGITRTVKVSKEGNISIN